MPSELPELAWCSNNAIRVYLSWRTRASRIRRARRGWRRSGQPAPTPRSDTDTSRVAASAVPACPGAHCKQNGAVCIIRAVCVCVCVQLCQNAHQESALPSMPRGSLQAKQRCLYHPCSVCVRVCTAVPEGTSGICSSQHVPASLQAKCMALFVPFLL